MKRKSVCDFGNMYNMRYQKVRAFSVNYPVPLMVNWGVVIGNFIRKEYHCEITKIEKSPKRNMFSKGILVQKEYSFREEYYLKWNFT